MIILAKLFVALCALVYRYSKRKFSPAPAAGHSYSIDGITCGVSPREHKGKITATLLTVPLRSKAVFKLSQESLVDRIFKRVGLATEIQTGDQAFDTRVYIASDSTAFSREVSLDGESRRLILNLFTAGARFIQGDRDHLGVQFAGDETTNTGLKALVIKLARQLGDMDRNVIGEGRDPFFLKAVAVECLVYGLATYASVSFFEWQFMPEDVHLDSFAVLTRGIGVGVAAAVALLIGIILIFKGSSRGHRILVESALILGLSLPVGGIALYTDLNTALDQSATIVQERTIYEAYRQEHRGRKGRTYYSYHLLLAAPEAPEELSIPGSVRVSASEFYSLQGRKRARFGLGRGFFNTPWIRGIDFL
ncbi:MAG: hypothetical protein EOP11_02195 [Proteobacteria bacterium]|nr:MAG: hypothetical protein EOP11_02195 [Pseudomonadota bacterium]